MFKWNIMERTTKQEFDSWLFKFWMLICSSKLRAKEPLRVSQPLDSQLFNLQYDTERMSM